MKSQRKLWMICFVFLAFGIAIYMNTQHSSGEQASKSSESSFKNETSKVVQWYSRSPQTVLNAADAETDISNIKAIQKAGWKLLMQNGQPVSFNANVSGRNDIMERSAVNLINGCYELLLDSDGNIVDIKSSEDAKKIFEEKQKQAQEQQDQQNQKQQQDEHDNQHSVIQNNIDDIYRYVGYGYRFKLSNEGNETITTWNINHKDDNSPGLEYSVKKLMSMGISVKSDEAGKVIGFEFNQTDFYEDKFDLHGMTH